eukprot:CAMPEP_0170483372 /NCGR_PEP_ID=MMETSP0208-20121228/3064_1 /TAXON_ID=197538 /ORGANISM="Strombidium inclinatum, Strain S3" /LENGTH=144 /DNA_ID=CAMNT_0010756381 /DNA_START=834 /DNA_END=1267 /DNA_ORIENTATION=+
MAPKERSCHLANQTSGPLTPFASMIVVSVVVPVDDDVRLLALEDAPVELVQPDNEEEGDARRVLEEEHIVVRTDHERQELPDLNDDPESSVQGVQDARHLLEFVDQVSADVQNLDLFAELLQPLRHRGSSVAHELNFELGGLGQ